MSRSIDASEFEAKCLDLIEEASRTGEAIVVTRNGHPLVEVIPCKPQRKSPFGILKGELEIIGDIMSPIDVEWDAMR